MKLPFFLLASTLMISAAQAATPDARTVERIVDAAASKQLEDRRFSGVVYVAQNGQTLVRKAYGLADRERGIPNTPETRFMIMSVSKQFTAALILRLAAQNRLHLDDCVAKYIPDWPTEWKDVTIHDLLTHTAGTDIDTTYFWLVQHDRRFWAGPGAAPRYEPRRLLSSPGSAFLYSNVGFTVLSLIASAAGGKPFDELMRTEVFGPLGMSHTEPERAGRTAGRARGYRRTEDGLALSEQGTTDIVGAGDLVSTVDDLAKWDAALEDDRFLPASLRSAMFTPHAVGRLGEVGYGWFFRNSSDGRLLQFHPGSGAGFRAWNYRVPELGLTVIVLSNVEESGSSWVPDLVDSLSRAVGDATRLR